MSLVNFGELLNISTRMSVRHNDSVRWIPCNLTSFEGNIFEISTGMDKLLIDKIVSVGDVVKCKFFSSDFNFEYILMGFIENILPSIPYTYQIKAYHFEKQEFVRNSPRYDVYLSAILKLDPNASDGFFVTVNNISKTGLAFITEVEIERFIKSDSQPSIYLDLYIDKIRSISIEGVIVRKDITSNIEYGVKMTYLNDISLHTLNDFICEISGDPSICPL